MNDERSAESQAGLLADIRRIVDEEGRPRAPAAFDPASPEGVLSLTPAMRTGAGAPGSLPPRGSLPPAEDEEPPLVLTRRVDQPEQPFGTGSGPTPSAVRSDGDPAGEAPDAEAAASSEEEIPVRAASRSWLAGREAPTRQPALPSPAAAPGREAGPDQPRSPLGETPETDRDAEPLPPEPASQQSATPEPEVFAAAPGAPPAEAAHPEAPSPDDAAPEHPLTSEPTAHAPGVVAARIPRFGAPFGQAAAPQDVRRAFASQGAPGPIPASGLPRNREELLALTRQAIREELAGPLGERISQNIKLLIEREVRRAVADLSRDEGDDRREP